MTTIHRWILETNRRSWTAFTVVMLLLLLALTWLWKQQLEQELKNLDINTQQDVMLFSSIIAETLRDGQYQNVNEIITSLGQSDSLKEGISVTAKNGTVIASYKRTYPAEHSIEISRTFKYAYNGQATLFLRHDLGDVYDQSRVLATQLAFIYAILGMLYAIVTNLAHLNYREANTLRQRTLQLNAANQSLKEENTERKLAEERFRYAVEAAPNAMIMADAKGNIALINSRTSAMFGYTQEELIGQPINLLLPTRYRAAHTADINSFIEHPARRPMGRLADLYALNKDGREFPVEVGLNPLQTKEGLFVIASVIDITELKLAMEKLQEKNAELERYSQMVSHDLKSPLVTIKTFLGYLKEDMAQGDAARIEQDMEFMSKAADKMGQLLDELMEISRIGRVVSLPGRVVFRELVQEALNINAGAIAQRGVAVTVDDADVILSGERQHLQQVWQNLIDNAVKFMGGQSEPKIHIGVEQGDGKIRFYVCDNGMGIDKRYHDKIFGMFEKLDSQTQGSGLGLALVKRIVQLYHGEIYVESGGIGQGACFRFTLPEALKNSTSGGGSS